MTWTLLQGDALAVLATLDAGSVHCAVTSPPYWGGVRRYAGLDDTQLGLERTPDEYVARLVAVFEAVRMVLRDDGTLWVNLGEKQDEDGVAGIPWRFALAMQAAGWRLRASNIWAKASAMPESVDGWRWERCRVKVKNQEEGRYPDTKDGQAIGGWNREQLNLAQWADCPGCAACLPNGGLVLRRGQWRTTRSHEYLFQFAKSDRYYSDRSAVATPHTAESVARFERGSTYDGSLEYAMGSPPSGGESGANPRSVLRFPTEPLSIGLCRACGRYYRHAPDKCSCGAKAFTRHYAAFPTSLPEWCIKASTSEVGCCAECGAPFARVVEQFETQRRTAINGMCNGELGVGARFGDPDSRTLGWRATCQHRDAPAVPCVVLDPFCGSGSTLIAATRLGRASIGIELSADYVALARHRIADEAAQCNVTPESAPGDAQGALGLQ